MSTAIQQYQRTVEGLARRELTSMLGEQDGARAAARFALAFRQTANSVPDLYSCSPESVGRALAMSLLTGLLPGGPVPRVYMFPRRIKGTQTVQWQVAPAGYVELARRAGARPVVVLVFRGEEEDAKGQIRELAASAGGVYIPPARETAGAWEDLIGGYVVPTDIETGKPIEVLYLSREEIEARRACSDNWRRYDGDSVWGKWPLEMARKTLIKYAASRAAMPLDDNGILALQEDQRQDTPEPVEVVDVIPQAPSVPSASATVAEALQLDTTAGEITPELAQARLLLQRAEAEKPEAYAAVVGKPAESFDNVEAADEALAALERELGA